MQLLQVVVEVGDEGSELFIVMTGEMHVVSADHEFLCSLSVGDHFGEFAAFGVTQKRQATVIAGTRATAYIITPGALAYAFSNYPDHFAAIKQEVRERAIGLGLAVAPLDGEEYASHVDAEVSSSEESFHQPGQRHLQKSPNPSSHKVVSPKLSSKSILRRSASERPRATTDFSSMPGVTAKSQSAPTSPAISDTGKTMLKTTSFFPGYSQDRDSSRLVHHPVHRLTHDNESSTTTDAGGGGGACDEGASTAVGISAASSAVRLARRKIEGSRHNPPTLVGEREFQSQDVALIWSKLEAMGEFCCATR